MAAFAHARRCSARERRRRAQSTVRGQSTTSRFAIHRIEHFLRRGWHTNTGADHAYVASLLPASKVAQAEPPRDRLWHPFGEHASGGHADARPAGDNSSITSRKIEMMRGGRRAGWPVAGGRELEWRE